MPFTDDYHRTRALEAALEWVLFKLVSEAKDPKAVLADFNQHMLDREKQIDAFGRQSLLEGRDDIFSNTIDANVAMSELRENLVNSINISS